MEEPQPCEIVRAPRNRRRPSIFTSGGAPGAAARLRYCGQNGVNTPHCCTALGVGQATFTLGWHAAGWVHTVAAVLPPPH
jgi:hypothetical protein